MRNKISALFGCLLMVALSAPLTTAHPSGDSADNEPAAQWVGAATVVLEGFPASADEGVVTCDKTTGDGVGGFCVHASNVAAVYVEDRFLGSDIAFQVCLDSNLDGICTSAETRFSHGNDGTFENPVAVPETAAGRTGQIVVFICKGAHNLPQGPHEHDATMGNWEARPSGGGFSADAGFCGGSTGGGPATAPPVGKRYVVTP